MDGSIVLAVAPATPNWPRPPSRLLPVPDINRGVDLHDFVPCRMVVLRRRGSGFDRSFAWHNWGRWIEGRTTRPRSPNSSLVDGLLGVLGAGLGARPCAAPTRMQRPMHRSTLLNHGSGWLLPIDLACGSIQCIAFDPTHPSPRLIAYLHDGLHPQHTPHHRARQPCPEGLRGPPTGSRASALARRPSMVRASRIQWIDWISVSWGSSNAPTAR